MPLSIPRFQRAGDAGHLAIRVNHGTSEEPGMVTLTQYINDHLEGLQAEHLLHGSTFRLVGAREAPSQGERTTHSS